MRSFHLKHYDAADPLIVEALDQVRRVLGPDHAVTLLATEHLAHLRQHTGKIDEAEGLFRTVIKDYRRVRGPTDTADSGFPEQPGHAARGRR